jgi:O-antigen/teichoic acid export membrane protein
MNTTPSSEAPLQDAVDLTDDDLSLTYAGQSLSEFADDPSGMIDATASAFLPSDVSRRVAGGTSTLAAGVFIERGTGFVANILAARFAGTATFGAYALAISTANQISTYAAGGIGATAVRFSGKYSRNNGGYGTLARALFIVSTVSAVLALVVLWAGAAPIAHTLGKPSLTPLLRWAAISAAGIILLECARGFFVGQRQHAALLLLSILVGVGMLTLLPAAARRHDPIRMVLMQGVTTTGAVVLCLLLARPLGLREGRRVIRMPLRPLLSEVWSFGFIQLAGLVGSNLAGWWLITLLARSDKGLVQIGFFAIASQLRNLAGIAPSLLTEGSYAVMADPSLDKGDATARTPHRVMAICSFASLSVVLLLAAIGITIVPWVLPWIYGVSFKPAAMAVAIALAIAVVHMGNAPAAARLTIVSIKASGVINTVWAAFVAVAATIIFLLHGTAWLAMAIYFAAHLLSSTLVLLALKRKDHIPGGMTALFAFCATIALLLAVLAVVRGLLPAQAMPATIAMSFLSIAAGVGLYVFGRTYRWLPSTQALRGLVSGRLNRV